MSDIEQRLREAHPNSQQYASGSKILLEAADEIAAARDEAERLRGRVAELEHLIRYAQVESGVCMCGDEIKSHNQASGHSPVDIWDHASGKALEGTSEAWLLRKQAEAVDKVNRRLTTLSEETSERMNSKLVAQYCASVAGEEAQRLRQQAAELEAGDKQ